MKEKIINKKNIKNVVLIFLMIVYILAITPLGLQNDIFFDIKVGEKYVNEGIVLIDDFSIHENLKYVSHHFLVSVITYIVNNLFGFTGIYVLEVLLTCILAVLFYKANTFYVKDKKNCYLFVLFELIFMTPFISTRAQMYSYIFFLLEFILIENILRKKGNKKRNIVLLTLIPLFIANFHSGTLPIYFIIIFVYLLNYFKVKFFRVENEKTYIENLKYLFIPIIAGFGLMFINPFGVDGVLYSFKTLSNDIINNNIMEFQKTTIDNNTMFFVYSFIILIAYFISEKKVKVHQICFLLGSSFMTLLSLRHFSLFVIMSIVNLNFIEEMTMHLSNTFYKNSCDVDKQRKVLNVIMLIMLCIVCGYIFSAKNYEYVPKSFYPMEAVEYIKENLSEDDKIFNEYTWGSLLMYNNIKPFIDSRCDLYTEEYNEGCEVAKDYMNANKCIEDYNIIFKKYDIDYIFIDKETSLYNNLITNDKYNEIYSDEISSIFSVIK